MSHKATRCRRALRARPGLESMESRTLMNVGGADLGQYPLRSAGTSNTVLARFATGADPTPALNALGAFISRRRDDGPSTIVLGFGVTPEAAVASLRARPEVVYAEPNAVLHSSGDPVTNDPKLSQQWGLDNPNNVDIDAPQAWGLLQPKGPVVVAVIDSGIDLTHPDLAGKVWVNTGEIAGNRRDDDRDGYIDDTNGWNFVNNTGNVQDNNGHGTHVAGIIAAVGNNGIGIVGVNGYARIMPLKFLDATGNGSTDDAVSAIYFAANHGARVINASWGGSAYSAPLRDAIAYASARNVVFVTAAGNDSANNDVSPSYPGNERLPGEITVAAVDRSGNLASFSNYGPTTVDVAGPGVGIVSTIPGGYATYSGTSMATPYVAGVASLVVMQHPEYTSAQVESAIKASAKPLPGLSGRILTGGIVSASRALAANLSTINGGNDLPPVQPTPVAPPAATDDDIRAALLGSDEFNARNGAGDSGFIRALYRDLLGREADPYGLSTWGFALRSGTSRPDAIRLFLTSPEALATQVATLYRRILGRTESVGFLKSTDYVNAWIDRLAGSGSMGTVEAALLASDEYFATHGGTAEGLIRGIYADLLARPVDPLGLSVWISEFSRGPSRFDVIRRLQGSEEARAVRVARWYQTDLGRPGSLIDLRNDPGVIGWAQQLGG